MLEVCYDDASEKEIKEFVQLGSIEDDARRKREVLTLIRTKKTIIEILNRTPETLKYHCCCCFGIFEARQMYLNPECHHRYCLNCINVSVSLIK